MLRDIWHSPGAIRFRMLRWALGIPAEYPELECSDEHLAFHPGIQILNAQMGIGHSTGAFILRKLIGIGHSS